MNRRRTDAEIAQGFRGNEAERRAALRDLYLLPGLREKVFSAVRQAGGSTDEVLDVFQDAIVVADRKLRAGEFRHDSALSTWVVGIAKWVWVARQQKNARRRKLLPIEIDAPPDPSPEMYLLDKERIAALDAALDGIGDFCKKLLKMYGLNFSMHQIAENLELQNANHAKDRARDCRGKLRKLILKNPVLAELLI